MGERDRERWTGRFPSNLLASSSQSCGWDGNRVRIILCRVRTKKACVSN